MKYYYHMYKQIDMENIGSGDWRDKMRGHPMERKVEADFLY